VSIGTGTSVLSDRPVTPEQLESALDSLDGDSLAHLGAALMERARLRRRSLTVEEALEAIRNAPLSPSWESSNLSDVGRVVIATRLLIQRGWRADQIVDALCEAALDFVPHPTIAPEAVAKGIAEARSRQR
jgi:hypothetical protein